MRRTALTLCVALALAACGDDGGTADEATDGPSDPPPAPTPDASTIDALLDLDRPLVIAHAGGDRTWPHSTMYAFRQAALAGVDVLEMDVQLTADEVLVVQHDDTVDRTTDGSGRVRDFTYDELSALDNAYWHTDDGTGPEFADAGYTYRGIRTGEGDPPEGFTADDFRIETLRSIAEAFPDHVLDVEIKVPRGDDDEADLDWAIAGAEALAAEIDALDRADSVVVASFSAEVLDAFRTAAPDVITSPATDPLTAWFFEDAPLAPSDRVLQIPPDFDGIDLLTLNGFLDKAVDEDLAVWVWPNAAEQENADFYESLLDHPVDGVIAGRPDDAVERFGELSPS